MADQRKSGTKRATSVGEVAGGGNGRPGAPQPQPDDAAPPAAPTDATVDTPFVDAGDGLPYNPFEGMAIPTAIPDTRPTAVRIVTLRKAGANIAKGVEYYSVMCVIPRVVLTVTGGDVGDAMLVMGWPDGTIVMRKAGEGG